MDAYTKAWVKNDSDAVMRTLASDAVLVPAHAHAPISGQDAIRQFWWPPDQPPTSVTAFTQSVDEIDGTTNLAYVRGTFELSFTSGAGGPVISRRGAFFMIVRRQPDGRWVITRRMWDDVPDVQPTASPTVQAAIARLQANDARGAATILQQLVERQPTDARLWRLLGTARQRAIDLDGALTAYEKALEIDPGYPAPLYNIAAVHALKSDTTQAFDWLSKAKRTGKIDMTQIETDPDFVSVRKDVRYKTLLPTAKDFERPFVEPVTILREWDGEATNDQFGWIARNIGDVDGDGVPDVVTSAPSKNNDAGRVYVYSTKNGRLLWQVDGSAGDELGLGVEGAGDTNGDGIPDVIASAPGRGAAYIYSGKDGRLLQTFRPNTKPTSSAAMSPASATSTATGSRT